ncbi:MAG TPA: hypothetical protein VFA65_24235 [Bryobacteraceae bacterium]|nr:hypothetical protein [Bryobacteraceae bacterium]
MAANQQIVDFLQHYLDEAKKNPYEAAAVTMVGKTGVPYGGHGGHITMQYLLLEAITNIGGQLRQSMENWMLPPRNPVLDASYFVYSMLTCPLGFDFLVWLINAEMTRKRFKADGPLKVCFWEGRNPDGIPQREARQNYLNNIFRPLLKMFGGVEVADPHGWYKESYVVKDVVQAARDGEEVPKFIPSKKSLFPGYITITLREADHWSERNSRLNDWYQFGRYLEGVGEKVVVVRDTSKAFESFRGLKTCPEASVNLEDRLALYDEAKMNFFVSNGPVSLAVFSDAPWMQFVTIDPKEAEDFWQKTAGMSFGEQYPWAKQNQRIIWKPDTYENLVAAWDSKLVSAA